MQPRGVAWFAGGSTDDLGGADDSVQVKSVRKIEPPNLGNRWLLEFCAQPRDKFRFLHRVLNASFSDIAG